ncbi:MAG: enoyl-CoA hydratase/isomerase family protein [Halioglobus sp.]|nr:enoyl-CoA hydratase/isomerase family protein [Halioglobus sp.]
MQSQPDLTDALLTVNDRVATLVLNRDDVRNELTGTQLVDDICRTVDWINTTLDISALVITGVGRAFCAGGNIKDIRNRRGMFDGNPALIGDNYRHGIQRMSLAMHSIEVPVIAAVNGPGIGAGFDLACMCDIRLGTPATRFGETFINLGLIPGDGGAWFLQRLVGYQRAAELTFSGRIIDAEEAEQLGLLLEIVTPDDLLPRANEIAQRFADKPPQALRMSKRLLKAAQRLELGDLLDLSASLQANCHYTADHQRAMEAMLDKTRTLYEGN